MARGRKPTQGRNTSPRKFKGERARRKTKRSKFTHVKKKLESDFSVHTPEVSEGSYIGGVLGEAGSREEVPGSTAIGGVLGEAGSREEVPGRTAIGGVLGEAGSREEVPGSTAIGGVLGEAGSREEVPGSTAIGGVLGEAGSREEVPGSTAIGGALGEAGSREEVPGSTADTCTYQGEAPATLSLEITALESSPTDVTRLSAEELVVTPSAASAPFILEDQEYEAISKNGATLPLDAIPNPTSTVIVDTATGAVDILESTSVEHSPSHQNSSSHSDTARRMSGAPVEQAVMGEPLTEVQDYLKLLLPDRWFPLRKGEAIHIGLLAPSKDLLIQRAITFAPDGTVSIYVHGKDLPPDNKLWEKVTRVVLTPRTVKEFSENIVKVAYLVRQHEVCAGVQHYQATWKNAPDSCIDTNPFKETRYSATCRSNSCLLLVPGLKIRRCGQCTKLDSILMKRSDRAQAEPGTPKTPAKNRPHKSLSTPQKKKRMSKQSHEIKALRQSNKRQREKIKTLMKEDGVKINGDLSDDFASLLESVEGLTDLQKLFIRQQLDAAKAKRSCGMRWHPALIRLALSIRMASPAAYEELSGILKLPSERQLFDYSHVFLPQEGPHPDIISALGEEVAKKASYQYQYLHVLSLDEVHLKKNLVFNKRTGELIGYVKLDPVEKAMKEIERLLSAKVDEEILPESAPPPVADKLLCYMVQGVADHVKAVVACYATAIIDKESLYRKTWEVIAACELVKVQILAVVCDGASVNRGFIQMHKPITQTDSGTVFDTINRYSPDHRPLYFLTDPPHLLKTLRNCLYSTTRPRKSKKKGKKKEGSVRTMMKNGEKISWETVVKLYNEQKTNTIRTTFKLNQEDVYLTSYSIMSVSKAAHVLSRSVATAVRSRDWEGTAEFARFCETCNDMFDMMNGNHTYHGSRTRNPNFDPYEKIDDPRFEELKKIWQYFVEWKAEISAQKVTADEKARRLISAETYQGVERTIKGFCGAMRYVLEIGKDCDSPPKINARVFSQDDLEHYFGKLRAKFGGNRHPNLKEALQAHTTIHVTSRLGLKGRKRGNTQAHGALSVEDLSGVLKKRKKKGKENQV